MNPLTTRLNKHDWSTNGFEPYPLTKNTPYEDHVLGVPTEGQRKILAPVVLAIMTKCRQMGFYSPDYSIRVLGYKSSIGTVGNKQSQHCAVIVTGGTKELHHQCSKIMANRVPPNCVYVYGRLVTPTWWGKIMRFTRQLLSNPAQVQFTDHVIAIYSVPTEDLCPVL